MPRKPTLSPTRISTYLACPTKFYWTYESEQGRWYLRSKNYYSFGTTLHKVLERFHDSGDVGVTSASQVMDAYSDSWIDAGFSSADEMQEAFGEGKRILERYVEEERSRPTITKVIGVEQKLKLQFGEDFDLVGRIDRIDEHPDGTLEIIDYKTGRVEVSEEEVETDLAMSIYQLLVREKYPGRPVCATIVAVRSGSRATYSLDDQALEVLKQDIEVVGKEILGANWEERRAVVKPLCVSCDFRALCTRDAEFKESLLAFQDS